MSLTAEKMEKAFGILGAKAIQANRVVDIAVYGGSALAVAYDLRESTKDVDAVFERDKDFVRKVVLEIAEELGLPEDWLNDAVKGYVSPKEHGNLIRFASYPSEENVGLRVFVPSPRYFFAMKCIDIRWGGGSYDVEDVKKLALICKIKDANEALRIVESFYPGRKIPPKTGFALEEIFETLDLKAGISVGRSGFDKKLEEFSQDEIDSQNHDRPSMR